MIFKLSPLTILRDLKAFPEITKNRQAHFDAGSDVPPDVDGGVNAQAKRLHPDRQTLTVRELSETANGALTAKLCSADGFAVAPFIPGQYLNILIGCHRYPVFLLSSPADAAKGEYTVYAGRSCTPDAFGALSSLNTGDTVISSGPAGTFTFNPIRDKSPVTVIADAAGIAPACVVARQLTGRGNAAAVFFIGCRKEDFFDFEHSLVSSSEDVTAAGGSVFVYGGKDLCAEAEKTFAGAKLRLCVIDEPETQAPPDVTFSCELRSPEGDLNISVRADTTLLRSFEDAGVKQKAKCMRGECGFCRCRLISGAVTHDFAGGNDMRRAVDIKRGVIHPCRAFPESDLVIAVN